MESRVVVIAAAAVNSTIPPRLPWWSASPARATASPQLPIAKQHKTIAPTTLVQTVICATVPLMAPIGARMAT